MAGKVKIWCTLSMFFAALLILMNHVMSEKSETTVLDAEEVIVVVMSQTDEYHLQRSTLFIEHFEAQAQEDARPKLYLMHKTWPSLGSWTLFPILKDLSDVSAKVSWVFFCEEDTRLQIPGLLDVLARYNKSKDWFLGRGLQDQEATIIHHFAFHENPSQFSYPSFAAGFALSMPLIKKLSKKLHKSPRGTDFSIDPKHELAMYIWEKGNGEKLTNIPEFCYEVDGKHCVTTFPHQFPNCGKPVNADEIFFAVKTYSDYHKDRVPIIKGTWGKEVKHIEYYSDVYDKDIPTMDIGLPNTERGHCAKTLAIMRRALDQPGIAKRAWLVIADDDTLLSFPRLQKLLACYSPSDAIALGERYGYQVAYAKPQGYDYITGGGGMVFSMTTVHMLMESGMCRCSSIDAPDDMTIGMCLKRLAIPIIHLPHFHQARPNDYSVGYLAQQIPVSFHKFWMNDPYEVYNTWLKEGTPLHRHDEL